MSSPRVLVYDIETSPLKVYTFSLFKPMISIGQIIESTRVISWAAKWHDEEKVMFMSEYHHGHDRMIKRAWELLNEADILVQFNGNSFDEPQLRREFKQAGLPPFSPVQTVDLYRAAKRSMYFPSYKLDWISRELGVGQKLGHEGFDLWRKCLEDPPEDDPNRQKRAWAKMRAYNKQDVVLTEQLYVELLPYIPNHPHMGLFTDEPAGDDRCDVCGGTNLRMEGFAYTKVGKYQRYQCREDGKWGRGKKALVLVDGRGMAS